MTFNAFAFIAAFALLRPAMRNLIVQGFMVEATEATGGQFIHNNNDLNGGLEALATPPRFSYTLGISPTGEPDGKYHKLKVSLTKAGNYSVSARTGYFATPPEKSPETAQQYIDRVAASAETLAEIPATVSVKSAGENDGRLRIQVEIAVDARGLKFSEKDGASVQQLTFVTILEDAHGNFVEGKQAEMDMNLTPKTRADLEAHGLKAGTFFLAPKGSYQIREVVREAVNNHIAASTHALAAGGEK